LEQQAPSRKCGVVDAQFYIKELYEKIGFKSVGDTFTEAGIIHLKMTKGLN
jgi:predicted GNAT family N-acyltransferase